MRPGPTAPVIEITEPEETVQDKPVDENEEQQMEERQRKLKEQADRLYRELQFLNLEKEEEIDRCRRESEEEPSEPPHPKKP